MDKILKNISRSASLQPAMFVEAKTEPELASHAFVTVFFSCIAAGIGSIGRIGIAGIVLGTFGALASWAVWVGLVYFVSTVIIPAGKISSLSGIDFLRISGFSSAPGIIRVLGIIPVFYPVTTIVAYLWMTAAMAVALKKTGGYKTFTEAALINAGSWIVMYLLISVFLSSRVF